MRETIDIINRMQSDGIIGRYAIGGAVGATFYLEPGATVDLDIFAVLPTSGALVSLASVYKYLKARGGFEQDEYIVLGGWPVQFLPPGNQLEEEAIQEAVATTVEGTQTWIITAEHLAAIALQTGRAKDHIRILQFFQQGALDREKLKAIVQKHGLAAKWKRFEGRFLSDQL